MKDEVRVVCSQCKKTLYTFEWKDIDKDRKKIVCPDCGLVKVDRCKKCGSKWYLCECENGYEM